jgi:hypothetical protein
MSNGAPHAATLATITPAMMQRVNRLLKSLVRAWRSCLYAVRVGTSTPLNGPVRRTTWSMLGTENASTKASMAAVAPKSQA